MPKVRSARARRDDRRSKCVCGGALALLLLVVPRVAFAQACAKNPSGLPRLCRNDFAVDVYQGPVLAPLRATGLAGAYAALADGVDALGSNIAAATVRPPQSSTHFDYDVTVGVSLPGAFGKTDFDNSGRVGIDATTFFYTAGGLIQLGPLGIGVLADFQRFTLSGADGGAGGGGVVTVGRLHAGAGYTVWDGQLSIGVGIRGLTTSIDTVQRGADAGLSPKNAFTVVGLAPEIGFLLRPDYQPFRIGGTYRAPVEAGSGGLDEAPDSDGVVRRFGVAIPSLVRNPWEVEVGVALSAGPRPLNPHWIEPHAHEASLRQRFAQRRLAVDTALDAELRAAGEDTARRAAIEARRIAAQAAVDDELRRTLEKLEEERRARFRNWPRERILISASALVAGASRDAVSILSFLRQEDIASGRSTTIQPRLGIEGEPVPGHLAARVGTYLEPSRYDLVKRRGPVGGARQHFTMGLEYRIGTWDVLGLVRPRDWSVQFAGDFAPRYTNLGLSISVWY
jgi:hypothetical protein